ncbi:MAG: bifunctional diguanylate cyclase/phosphodiesterase [Vicinamibacteria bacterium]|nr:bifunctional diguanylate cyclase/phosphodiesterase [Vicinamibacteria bacterium]
MALLPEAIAAEPPVARSPAPFPLVRHLALTGLVGVLVLLPALVGFSRHISFHALEEQQIHDNVALTQLFANSMAWTAYADFVREARALSPGVLARRPEIAALRADLARRMRGLNVARVKLYDLSGLTVFSTEASQIGQLRGDNAGFQAARGGRPASQIVFHEQFSSFEGEVADRNLVASYVPLRRSLGAPIEGVLEVYSDVTPYVAKLEATQWQILAAATGGLGLLFTFFFLSARRAEALIRRQARQVSAAHESLLRYQARHDPLTGLPVRLAFAEAMDRELRTAQRSGARCAVLAVDVERFKDINDSYGHATADELLREVAGRLRKCIRVGDLAARAVGDEFLIGLPGVAGVEAVTHVAEKVQREVFGERFAVASGPHALSASIGAAVSPEDGTDAAEMIQSASAALHQARRLSARPCQFHAAEMNSRVLDLLATEHRLREALERHDFRLHYQPQLELGTGRLVGVEALIRWQHADLGSIAPIQFIPIAEERGLIVPLGNWVLEEACRQHRAWRDEGLPAIPVAVNVSPRQFAQGDLVEEAKRCLRTHDLAPGALELEVTESTTMDGTDEVIRTMRALQAAGVRLSLDDFGTGYSSLSQLKRLPLDRVKLDQSFVRGLPDDGDDSAIAGVVIEMGRALGLRVLAEGAETLRQVEFLQERGCHEAQGFYFARALPPAELARFVRAQPGAVA